MREIEPASKRSPHVGGHQRPIRVRLAARSTLPTNFSSSEPLLNPPKDVALPRGGIAGRQNGLNGFKSRGEEVIHRGFGQRIVESLIQEPVVTLRFPVVPKVPYAR